MTALDPHVMLVSEVMTRDVKTVDPNDRLLDADRLASVARIRHLPVVDDEGLLVGIVSQRDIFHSGLLKALGYGSHAQERVLESFVIKDVMVTDVQTIAPEATVADAARRMSERRIGCLPVLQGEALVGIVTESDLVSLLASRRPG